MSDVEKNITTDSSDDEDYKPEENNSDAVEDESDCSDGSDGDDAVRSKGKKQTSRRKRRKKCALEAEESKSDKEEENDKSLTAEEEKERADALWANFLSDVDPPPGKADASSTDIATTTTANKAKSKNVQQESNSQEKPKKLAKVEIFDFAGEEVKVPVENSSQATKRPAQGAVVARSSRTSGGLSSVLGSIGKKPKISTLEKTKLDWDRFKASEGIGEDLERFNKGKDGYLERQDFLERTDYRQFDREREMRQTKRSTR
uniref:Craniofacial development protein 1 n=1 Tax=Lutzomyia longipalpis TaxID=7200 RepID=A0A1B0GGX7_LUTLO